MKTTKEVQYVTTATTESGVNLSLEATATRLGITPKALYRLRATGGDLPPSFKVGRNIRYRLEDVERWEREQVEKETARRAAAAQQTATA
ncbi:AlpA family transcriptional regulator [Rothia nasimurium]|uniref:helix-turn-helix transcriptional regulator n=1 Tax=Rothia nasimurium TaxID=85336 RepID=UPI0016245595|nr:helix-turn-helix domain-containing protein [Rothia nasimurium]